MGPVLEPGQFNFRDKEGKSPVQPLPTKPENRMTGLVFASWDLDEASDSVPGALVLGITDLDLNQFPEEMQEAA